MFCGIKMNAPYLEKEKEMHFHSNDDVNRHNYQ